MLERLLQILRKLLINTPINQKYISYSALKRSLASTIPYVKGRLLDIGCGEKPYAFLFKGKIDEHLGLDLLSCYFEEMEVDVFGDAHNLPFRSESVDTILCTEVLVHSKTPKQIFKELERVIRQNGYIIITGTKSYTKIRSAPDYFRFTDDGLRYLAEDIGLKVVYIKPICGLPATIGEYLSRFLYGTFLINKKTKKPIIWLYPLVLPFCAVIQILFLLLDKIISVDSWETDTISYLMVAKKET